MSSAACSRRFRQRRARIRFRCPLRSACCRCGSPTALSRIRHRRILRCSRFWHADASAEAIVECVIISECRVGELHADKHSLHVIGAVGYGRTLMPIWDLDGIRHDCSQLIHVLAPLLGFVFLVPAAVLHDGAGVDTVRAAGSESRCLFVSATPSSEL